MVSKYTVDDHFELRTAIDTFLIAYDQAMEKVQDSDEEIFQLKRIILNLESMIEHLGG